MGDGAQPAVCFISRIRTCCRTERERTWEARVRQVRQRNRCCAGRRRLAGDQTGVATGLLGRLEDPFLSTILHAHAGHPDPHPLRGRSAARRPRRRLAPPSRHLDHARGAHGWCEAGRRPRRNRRNRRADPPAKEPAGAMPPAGIRPGPRRDATAGEGVEQPLSPSACAVGPQATEEGCRHQHPQHGPRRTRWQRPPPTVLFAAAGDLLAVMVVAGGAPPVVLVVAGGVDAHGAGGGEAVCGCGVARDEAK
mmetsp:Transcript_14680/g.46856  ORF Transcript_14680/g.46856 Transcript_14680/m.46856 type:complete len:251 (+) Transcript_14680:2458-3210(+)